MKWIGLTGGIASGKTTVTTILRAKGVSVICADEVAKQVVSPGSEAMQKIISYFGTEYLTPNNDLDRKKLGEVIFKDLVERKKLESIIHPSVQQAVKNQKKIWQEQGKKMAFYDVPLLFENNMQNDFDSVVCVYAAKEWQLKRLMNRNNLTKEQALDRLNSQLDIEDKKMAADFVIDNNQQDENYFQHLNLQVEKLLKYLN